MLLSIFYLFSIICIQVSSKSQNRHFRWSKVDRPARTVLEFLDFGLSLGTDDSALNFPLNLSIQITLRLTILAIWFNFPTNKNISAFAKTQNGSFESIFEVLTSQFSALLISICVILPLLMGFLLKGICRFSDAQATNLTSSDENASVGSSSGLTDSQTLSGGSTISSTPTTSSPAVQNEIRFS